MTPIEFDESNCVLAEDQPEYAQLPVFASPDPNGEMISCHQLSWRELLTLIITRRIWHRQLTFGRRYSPTLLQVEHPWKA